MLDSALEPSYNLSKNLLLLSLILMKLTVDMIMIQPPLLNNNVNVTQVPNEKEQELQEV